MEWVLWMSVVVILGLAAAAGSGHFGSMPDAVRDAPVLRLPEGDLVAEDLRRAQFATVVRGYAMAQVDELLDRLARQLEAPPSASGTFDADQADEDAGPPAWDHLR